MELQDLRREIDDIDDQLIRLFCRRMDVAARIGQWKKERGLPVLAPQREEEKLRDAAEKAGPAMAGYTRELFQTLMTLSRDHQSALAETSDEPIFGLLGHRLGHSYSPQIHARLGGYRYDLFEKEPQELEEFLRHGDFTGLNVTIPYKKAVIPYLDELSPTARQLGAVNTILRRPDGTLWGHNTDAYGFRSMVAHSGMEVAGRKVLVLGSGGASNTAVAVLQELGARVTVISRSGENNYENLELHADARIIVNTTPVGMYPNTGVSPVKPEEFPQLEGVLDLIYNPSRTQLLLDADNLLIDGCNGLWMLIAQAKESAECFLGKALPDSLIEQIHRELTCEMENIILIGMPGCGKTTVGRALAGKLGRSFVDADEKIQELAGKSIPEIFAQDGEAAFRDWETKALIALGKQSGLVIATGGGCVTQLRNYPFLHQNGRILWLQRSLEKLPTDGRPLSQTNSLAVMYEKRRPLYAAFADATVSNEDSLERTLQDILSLL